MNLTDMAGGRLSQAKVFAARMKADPRSVSEQEVVQALTILPEYYFRSRRGVHMHGVGGAADWLEYEILLWQLSELVRTWVKGNRKRGEIKCVLDAVAAIVLDKRLAKGRQHFILILGEYGGKGYADMLGQALNDPDVSGHAVKALVRSRAPGYVTLVERLLSEPKPAWVRSAARKYVAMMREQG
jgi:hypothetical protein